MRQAPVVIIGAGPGGCAAAIQCARLGIKPLLLDRTGTAGGLIRNAYRVENYPALEPVTGPELAEKLQAQLQRLDLPVTRGNVVAVTLPEQNQDNCFHIQVTGMDSYVEGSVCNNSTTVEISTCRLIAATGTTPLHLRIPGAAEATGQGLFYEVYNYLKSSCWIEPGHTAPRRIAVIGGGEAALNYSLTLARAGAQVSILIRSDRIAVARGKLVELVETSSSIEVNLSIVSKEIQLCLRPDEQAAAKPAGQIARLVSLTVENKGGLIESRDFDGVLCAIGRRSNISDLLPDCKPAPVLPIAPGQPGLYLIGDARAGSLGQVAIAAGDGLSAAAAAVKDLTE